MKQGRIYHQVIWIIKTLWAHGKMTLAELNERWVKDEVADGNPLQRSSFNRHRDAIFDMFGINIECERSTHSYYICNPGVLDDDSLGRWLLSTLSVHGVLADGLAIRDRLMLENVPSGEAFFEPVLRGVKTNRRLRMGYKKFFDPDGYVKTVSPLALKLSCRRWYLLAQKDDGEMRIYSLDRMQSVEVTDEPFEMPADFSAADYFADYFGVLTLDDVPLEHVVVRAYGPTPHYLRTLPLHHSQRELDSNDDYTLFSFDIRPTPDFLAQLLTHVDGIEVMEPASVRQEMRQMVERILKRY